MNKRRFRIVRAPSHVLRLLLVLACLLFPVSLSLAEENKDEYREQNSLRVGTASKSGAYYAFINDAVAYAEQSGLKIINVSTGGSVENIRLLKEQQLDAAIVQNDLAYYSYYNKAEPNRSFGAALPLFPEYFQVIVRKESAIHHIDALMGKRVILGVEGSGTYRNAKDVLKVAELTYTPVTASSLEEALAKLDSGEVDAICHTGASAPMQLQAPLSPLTIISLPDSVIDKLTRQRSYYHKGFLSRKNQDSIRTISLMAYLVFANHANPAAARTFMLSLLENWDALLSDNSYCQQISAVDLRQAIQRKPAPIHAVAKKVLVEKNYILDPLLIVFYLVALIIGTIFIHYLSHLLTINFDRLGNLKTARGLWRYQLTLAVQGFAVFIATLTAVALIYFGIMLTIQFYEGLHATENDVYNPFATMSIPEAMLWLWGWIGGHEGNIFPQSTVGKILVIFPPIVGIFSIGWLAFSIWRGYVARRIAEQKGSFVLPMKQHVLICGWNEKARGIIFGLTTRYAPERKNIVVVAEMDDEKPLEKYNFPKGCVYYYRGDSSDRKALEGSHAANASAALILAGDKKKRTNNIGSVLTSLAINKQNPDIFTVAELRYEENIEKFEACHVDTLVYADTIVYRLAAQACFNPHAVSFFLDMITHDEHSEIYAMPVSTLVEGGVLRITRKILHNQGLFQPFYESARFLISCGFSCFGKRQWLKKLTPAELHRLLAQRGTSLIAVCHHSKSTGSGALMQHTFSDGFYTDFASHTSEATLENDDILIYSALEKEDIYPAMKLSDTPQCKSVENRLPGIIRDTSLDCHILLIGDANKCSGIIEQLQSMDNLHYRVMTESEISADFPCPQCIKQVPDLLDFDVLNEYLDARTDAIIILSDPPSDREILLDHDHGVLDARALIIAQHISRHAFEGSKPRIIAEMIGRNSRELFKNAGVDVVLPSNLAVERMMIKMAYGYGAVSNYLMAALALNDSAHMDSIVLKERDTAWLNLNYKQLLLGMPEQMHLLAVYPADARMQKKLFNELQDFGRHFISNPQQGEYLRYVSRAGDSLLVLNAVSKSK